MGTWPEARAAKAERDRREHRHWTRDLLGRPCGVCRQRIPLVLGDVDVHPCCDPEARHLLALQEPT